MKESSQGTPHLSPFCPAPPPSPPCRGKRSLTRTSAAAIHAHSALPSPCTWRNNSARSGDLTGYVLRLLTDGSSWVFALIAETLSAPSSGAVCASLGFWGGFFFSFLFSLPFPVWMFMDDSSVPPHVHMTEPGCKRRRLSPLGKTHG